MNEIPLEVRKFFSEMGKKSHILKPRSKEHYQKMQASSVIKRKANQNK